jgi:hypothetical protein
MSTDDKSRAAAAQQAIDDEPDDWYVQLMRSCKQSPALMSKQGQEDLQHGLRRWVRLDLQLDRQLI